MVLTGYTSTLYASSARTALPLDLYQLAGGFCECLPPLPSQRFSSGCKGGLLEVGTASARLAQIQPSQGILPIGTERRSWGISFPAVFGFLVEACSLAELIPHKHCECRLWRLQ